MILSWTGSIPV